jgi:uncharacterized protein YnzC (UPF0291/DUF896 family)
MADFNVDRINELANKSKTIGLTQEEKEEQQVLRKAYIESFRNNMRQTLDQVYMVDEKGNKTKLEQKK